MEVRAVIRYEWARGTSVSVIHERLQTVYGEQVMSRQRVGRWCCMFSEGRQSVEDEGRSGRPSTSTNENNIARVQDMVLADRRITVSDVASTLRIGRAQAHHMLHDVLGYRKVSARWVPRDLTPDHKSARMGISLDHLMRYAREGNEFLFRIITGDETWVHHFTPETKAASMTWKHPSSPVRKKFKVSPSAGKVMATVFWDAKGVILLDFLHKGTINAARYCDTLTKLRSAIRRKRPGLLSQGVVLLDDNATPHRATLTKDQIRCFGWERLDHPAYSPDLAPSDFHLFPALKAALSGRHFQNNAEVEQAVRQFLASQGTAFYQSGFFKLIARYDKCLNVGGDYVEK